jgi:branched-chain amino acid transport system substrate-binding protein
LEGIAAVLLDEAATRPAPWSKTMKLSTVFIGTILAALLAASPASAQIKIGVFGPMTGDAATYGLSLKEGVEIALKERNAAGGVLGQKIEVVYGDDTGKPEQAVSVATDLATKDKVLIMLGSISSPASLAASQVAAQTETPQIAITSTAQSLTTQGNPWVFRSILPDTGFASSIAEFVARKFPSKTKYAFIYVNDDMGKSGFEKFSTSAQKLGMTLVADEKYTRGDLDFTSQLSRIRAANPDFIAQWSRYTEQALITKQVKQAFPNVLHVAGDGTPKFIELAGEAAEGVYYPSDFSIPTAKTTVGKDLVRKVKESYNRDADYVHAQAYDAFNAAVIAIKAAGTQDKTKIRDALKKVDFAGARGTFKFDQKGDPTHSAGIILVKGGKETDANE